MGKHLRLIVLAWFLLILSPGARAEEPLKLGFLAPLSGEAAAFGIDRRNAVELALEDIRAGNLLPGRTISVVYEDGRCSGKDSATAASKLVNVDKVQAIIAGGCSGEVLGAAPVTERAKVILLASAAESTDITRAGDYVFRICVNAHTGAQDVADWIRADGLRDVAAISENSDYALNFRKVFAARLNEFGISLAADAAYNPNETDFRVMLGRLRAGKPQALFINPQTGNKAGLIVKQLREFKWSVPIYGNYSFGLLDAPAAAGGLAVLEGVKFVDYPMLTKPRGLELVKRFQQHYGTPQTDFNVAATYDAAMMLVSAIKAVGYDGTAIRDYLYQLPAYDGTASTFRFDENGDAQGIYYAKKIVRGGQIAVVPRS
jgi:branched-chain amino acid transport system substrate-binding protein